MRGSGWRRAMGTELEGRGPAEEYRRYGGWPGYLQELEDVGRVRVEEEPGRIAYRPVLHRGIIVRLVQLDLHPEVIASILGITRRALEGWIRDDPELALKLSLVTAPMRAARVYDAIFRGAMKGNAQLLMLLWKDMKLGRDAERGEGEESESGRKMEDAKVRRLLERLEARVEELEEPEKARPARRRAGKRRMGRGNGEVG